MLGRSQFDAKSGSHWYQDMQLRSDLSITLNDKTLTFKYVDQSEPKFRIRIHEGNFHMETYNIQTGQWTQLSYGVATMPVIAADLSMNDFKIIDLASPINMQDAINLSYLQDQFFSKTQISALPLSYFQKPLTHLDCNQQKITNLDDPQNIGDAVTLGHLQQFHHTKSEILALDLSYFQGQLISPLSMNQQRLTGVGYPTEDHDAVNLAHLNDRLASIGGGDPVVVPRKSLLYAQSTLTNVSDGQQYNDFIPVIQDTELNPKISFDIVSQEVCLGPGTYCLELVTKFVAFQPYTSNLSFTLHLRYKSGEDQTTNTEHLKQVYVDHSNSQILLGQIRNNSSKTYIRVLENLTFDVACEDPNLTSIIPIDALVVQLFVHEI